jgi:hypothetical protein
VLAACEFLGVMVAADHVAKCSVPLGAPSMYDTRLRGFAELAATLQSYAADW